MSTMSVIGAYLHTEPVISVYLQDQCQSISTDQGIPNLSHVYSLTSPANAILKCLTQ